MAREALISDSDPATLQQTAALLARAGFRVESTGDGKKAISIFLAQMPSLVVCSERLPGLTGIQLCQTLRQEGTAAKVILLYSRPLEPRERYELAADIGCDAVICRPFRATDLEHLLQNWDLLPAPEAEPEAEAASFALPVPIPLPIPLPVSIQASEPKRFVETPTAPLEPESVAPIPIPIPIPQIIYDDAPAPNLNVLDEAAEILDAQGNTTPSLLPPTVARINDLRALPLPRLLYDLYVGTYFGIVHLRREGVRRAIYFWAGMPVRVDTDQISESLGTLLVESKRLTEEEHHQAQRHAVANGSQLGASLLALGLLRESELLDALIMQTERKLVSTLAWRHGTYEIVDDVSFAVGELLGEADPLRAIWLGVSAHYESAGLLGYFEAFRSHYAVATDLFQTQIGHLRDLIGELDLTTLLNGRTTFQEALSKDATRAIDIARALYVLLVTDMIRVSELPGSALPTVESPQEAGAAPSRVDYQEVVAANDRIAREVIRAKSVDWFELLGVERDASAETIDAAAAAAQQKLQRDEALVGLPPEAIRRAREVAAILDEARRALTDVGRRAEYVASLGSPVEPAVEQLLEDSEEQRRSRFLAEQAYRNGVRQMEAGDPVGARRYFDEAINAHPNECTYRVGLAQAILAGGNRKSEEPTATAYHLLNEALLLDPGNILAGLEAAKLMLAEGLHEQARPYVERVLQRAPHHRFAQTLEREIRLRAAEQS